MPQEAFHIRWMIRRDMPEVLAIEKTHDDTRWTEEDFLKILRKRNVIGMVVEKGEIIVGFMIYELNKTDIQILNMAVMPQHRRQGVGRLMIRKLMGKLSPQRRTELQCDVRESNLIAQMFLKATGLMAYKVERNYFEDETSDGIRREDAYLFTHIIDKIESQKPVNTKTR